MENPIISLTVDQGPLKGQEFVFHAPIVCVVGRAHDCCPRIAAKEISRRHCIFKIEPPAVWVQDLESTNGTFLNRLRLGGKKAFAMSDGDEISLASHTIIHVHIANQQGEDLHFANDEESFLVKPNTSPACFEVMCTADELVIRFVGRKVRLGQMYLRVLQNHLLDLAATLGHTKMAIDLSNVECVDTEAIAIFVRLHQQLSALKGGLRAIHLSPYVYEICEAAKLFDNFEISRAKGDLVGSGC